MAERNRKYFRSDNFFHIPESGDIFPLKFICTQFSKYGANLSAENYVTEGSRFIRTSDIDDNGKLSAEGVYIDEQLVEEYKLEEGDFLISRSGTLGRGYLYNIKDGVCSYAGYLVKYSLNKNTVNPKFLFYCTKTNQFNSWLNYSVIEATIGNINGEKYANLPLPIPSPAQQKKIVDHLDLEVAKIDSLIEKKIRLINILEEKKKAAINQAVTKGLDPNVSMKDSGISWLGEIPKHWELVKLKYLTDGLKYGANEAAEDDNYNDPRYIRITDIDENGDLKEETFRSIPFAVAEEYLLQDGDILLARSGATVGKSFLYKNEYGVSAYAGYLIRVRCNARISSRYLYYYTLSSSYWNQIYIDSIQATIQNFNGEKYANMIVVVPDYDEQEKIIDSLNLYVKKFNDLKKKILLSLDLLQEKRTAIISAAVNGELNESLS